MSSLRDALEAALVADPDDRAAHHAYADYLQEQGDPRGEFIQVQLALEEGGQPDDVRRRLRQRERELLAEHQREWLGPLAEELLGPADDPREAHDEGERPYEFAFARGWVDRLVWNMGRARHGLDLLGPLIDAPQVRLLRELVLDQDGGLSGVLCRSPFLTNLRVFQVGGMPERPYPAGDEPEPFVLTLSGTSTRYIFSWTETEGGEPAPDLADFLARQPRLEELRLLNADQDCDLARLFALPSLTRLRVLQVQGFRGPCPLHVLADNPALGSLTHLMLNLSRAADSAADLAGVRAVVQSPHLPRLSHLQVRCSDLGDVGCSEIVTSGVLRRLRVLDLRHGEISDAGARTLADCPDLARLELLDVSGNALTQRGTDDLRRVLGPALLADYQQTSGERARLRSFRSYYEGHRG